MVIVIIIVVRRRAGLVVVVVVEGRRIVGVGVGVRFTWVWIFTELGSRRVQGECEDLSASSISSDRKDEKETIRGDSPPPDWYDPWNEEASLSYMHEFHGSYFGISPIYNRMHPP